MPIKIPSLLEMIKAGVHFGHRTSKWHPKMEPYIYTVKNTVHLINLEKTQEKLKEALDFVKEVMEKNGVILFLGTKKTIKEVTKKYAEKVNMPYINEKWIGGTMTNFSVISRLIKKLKDLENKKEKGEFAKYAKKEQSKFNTEIEKLNKVIKGIKNLDKLPEAIFMLDTKDEKTAIREAKKLKLPTIGIVDTNCNPEEAVYPIPANDDAIKSVEMITNLVAQAIEEGRKVTPEASS
ncbi:MAG: small subunit ribosomal protein S2 [Parcubacteria group bacterium Athens1014_10]|nr:MAG: small subunit ribosomal protein S2 [Parcubacteria group bacterium Athens1014_10]TSD06077.1 MAG: small subunit ribosomal protein S2 [Parcubacteria group bacterium Athens0714_12]